MGDYTVVSYKTKEVFERSHDVVWHEALIDLYCWVCQRWGGQTITSAYRPGERSVHSMDPLRGLDIRGKGKKAQGVVDEINRCWQYDSVRPAKKVAILHDVGRGEHIHLQVHPATVLIRSKKGGGQ